MLRKSLALASAALVILLLVTVVPWGNTQTASACFRGLGDLRNLGFEEGLKYWTVASKPDAAVVVGPEGPDQFSIYRDEGDITVSPLRGERMLRLGTPKSICQKQRWGMNTVSQTFISSSDSLEFAFRLFSLEYRGYDVFSFDLFGYNYRKGSKSVGVVTPFVITMPDGSTKSCSSLPCRFSIDVGKPGQFLDTGWINVGITGIPVGQILTLTYSVGSTRRDNAYLTWAYFDEAGNSPPVASFSFAPDPSFEGDIVQFADASYDPDPSDSIASWQWDIQKNGQNVSSDSQNPFFVPADDGTYAVSLTVTDTYGASSTAQSELVVYDAPPLVNALNIEALPNDDTTLFGRFLAPGWIDNHAATWTLDGWSGNGTLQEDHLPCLSSGVVSDSINLGSALGAVEPGDTFSGALTVATEGGSTSGSDDFTVTIVSDDSQSREPNDTMDDLASATPLRSDAIYLSYLQSEGDIDIFEVVMPDGQLLPMGAELLVTLKGLPADYDLILLRELPADLVSAPFQRSPFQRSSFQMSPFQRSPFQRSPFQRSPFQRSPFQRSPFQRSPFQRSVFTFDQYPLSEMGFTGLDGDNLGGTDITLAELGLPELGDNVTAVGFSANPGLKDEVVFTRSQFEGTRFFVAVLGATHSDKPYQLQVETAKPLDLEALLNCQGEPVVTPPTNDVAVLYQALGDVQTLFVTQRERLQVLYNMDNFSWYAFMADLRALARHPSVHGKIISVPSGIYDNWDIHPSSIDAANGVANEIRQIIQDELSSNPTIQYVVLVGSDDIIPYYRVPDDTTISNESYYTMDSFLKPCSPLFASVLQGFDLTDDYYVDLEPIPWQGRALYVPDLPIGRLVETPQQIRGAAQAFLSSNGTLSLQSALVTGYDFFSDGAQAVADNFTAGGLTTGVMINDTWSSDDLRSEFLGSPSNDINAINAHCTHYAALSANGFYSSDDTDFLNSEEVAGAGGSTPVLKNTLVFSMGCHAGLSVPDRAAEGMADPGLGIDPALDFPEAMAEQQAIYVASTGFGLGDDEGIGGTERLMVIFAENLMQDGITVGQALIMAKQQYLSSLSPMTVYDEKSSIQFTLYGLPQYNIEQSATETTSQSAVNSMSGSETSGTYITHYYPLDLNIIDGIDSSTTSYYLEQVDTESGSYFTADGDAQATAGRPMQPRVTLPLSSDSGDEMYATLLSSSSENVVHGALLTGGVFVDLSEFDPVITRPTRSFELEVEEPQIGLPSFWPAILATINNLETGGEQVQTLVVTPGQFRSTSGPGETVMGIERLYTDLTFELLRSNSDDYEPPVVSQVSLRTVNDDTAVEVIVEASDTSGIARIVVLNFDDESGTVTSFEPEELPPSGPFAIQIPIAPSDARLVIQVADGVGNVATVTGKGAFMRVIEVYAEQSYPYDNYNLSPGDSLSSGFDEVTGYPVFLQATVHDFTSLTAPVSFVWDFGDGTTLSGLLAPEELQTVDVMIDDSGNAIFTVGHIYSYDTPWEVTATVKITDANGGNGMDDVILYIWYPE